MARLPLFLLLFSLNQALAAAATFRLFSPINASALLDGVELAWDGAKDTNATFTATLGQEEASEDGAVCKLEFTATEEEGSLSFPCHCLPAAGSYKVSVRSRQDSSKPVFAAPLTASWPVLVEIAAPEAHSTLNGSVPLLFHLRQLPCRTLEAKLRLRLRIEYRSTGPGAGEEEEYRTVYEDELASRLSDLASLAYPCQIFDRQGMYRFALMGELPSSPPFLLGLSSPMATSWSPSYAVLMRSSSLLPCPSGRLSIALERPQCRVEGDRIRVYVVHRRAGRRSRLVYEKEVLASPDRPVVSLPCSFDIGNPGYCFKLVSVLPGGLVRERASKCLPTEPRGYLPLDGQWGSWAAWGDCSVTCGVGIHHRVRVCDSPAPLYGGAPCAGAALRTRVCDRGLCPNATAEFSALVVGSKECRCGCALSSPGAVVVSPSLCPSPAVWTFASPAHQVVVARLLSSSLDASHTLRLRDGLKESDALLLKIPGTEWRGREFRSSKEGVRIELEEAVKRGKRQRRAWQGAVIVLGLEDADVQVSELPGYTLWRLDLVALAVCLLVALVAAAFLCLLGYGLWAYTRRKMNTSCALLASQSLHSSSGASSSAEEQLRVRTNLHSSSRQLLSPSQLLSRESPSKTSPRSQDKPPQDKEAQPLLRQSRRSEAEARRSKQLSKILELPDEAGGVMGASVTTESTRLSGYSQKTDGSDGKGSPEGKARDRDATPVVVKRSIGIQLNSPALPLRRYQSVESRISAASTNPGGPPGSVHTGQGTSSGRCGSPLSFVGTEADFEYDYYEPNVPGSFLDWPGGGDLSSEIDIDQIIGDSDLMRTPTHRPAGQGSSESCESSSDASDKATQAASVGPSALRTPMSAMFSLSANTPPPPQQRTLFVSKPPFGSMRIQDSPRLPPSTSTFSPASERDRNQNPTTTK